MSVPVWKPIVIVAVLALCALSLYPPSQKLRPGLDLAGGTTLTYQVEVPGGADGKRLVNDVISVLKKRVDPQGVRNLIWRPLAGHRIEIQMPMPSKDTTAKRLAYESALKSLLADNLSATAVNSAMRAEADTRTVLIDDLARGSDSRRELLITLAQAYDAMSAAEAPYRAAEQAKRDKQAEIDKLPEDGREAAIEQLAALQKDITAKARVFVDARSGFNRARQKVLDTNLTRQQMLVVFDLPADKPSDDQDAKSQRDLTIEVLAEQHPGRSAQIDDVVRMYTDYELVRQHLEDPNDLKALLKASGVLEFRIVPRPGTVPDEQGYRDTLGESGPRGEEAAQYRWIPVAELDQIIEDRDDRKTLKARPDDGADDRAQRVRTVFARNGLVGDLWGNGYYVLLFNTPDASLTRAQAGWELVSASPGFDQNMLASVDFALNAVGGKYFGAMTASHINEPMATVLDGKATSIATINSRIESRGQITRSGGYAADELSYMILTLNAGSLAAALSDDPIAENTISASFGQDNINRGLKASLMALIIVAAFMMLYYLFWGGLADFALVANMVVVLGVMAAFNATFTLAGIAGIVLTIGMAVDANVLIFERIREELDRGADLDVAMRLGYDRALSTILDANITTFITAWILAGVPPFDIEISTTEVRGFATTLMIGIAATLSTSLFATRVIATLYVKAFKPKRLHMAPTLIAPLAKLLRPNINWVGKRIVFFTLSAVLIVAGILAVGSRGQDMLDIEFRSGTEIAFELKRGLTMSISEVRDRLDKVATAQNLPKLAGDRVTVVTVGDVQGDQGNAFSVATLVEDDTQVSTALKEAFGDVIETQRPIHFAGAGVGDDAPPVIASPRIVFPVRSTRLGANIKQPRYDADVSEFVGGVVTLVNKLQPPATIEQITSRIDKMRKQPQYSDRFPYRPFRVIGLEAATGTDAVGANSSGGNSGGSGFVYQSVAVVSRDGSTNYIKTPDTFANPGGLAESEWRIVRDALLRETTIGSVTKFSSQVSTTMKGRAIVALMMSLFAVVVYIAFRFGSLRYGLAAIAALVHDVAIAMGLVAVTAFVADTAVGRLLLLEPFRIDLALVAATLTIIGYSLNDTIVIFDRIRENRGRLKVTSPTVINESINQTFSRTVLTSGTTLLALLTLYCFGGAGVHGFAFAMIVGVLVGTYSSVAIAAPILLIGQRGSSRGNGEQRVELATT